MKKEIKDKWVAALNSGEYKQIKGFLKTNEGHCCLGVLCEIYAQETQAGEFKLNQDEYAEDKIAYDFKAYNTEDTDFEVLPDVVKDWAGIKTNSGEYSKSEMGKRKELTEDNDTGKSFIQIANIIENEWENL